MTSAPAASPSSSTQTRKRCGSGSGAISRAVCSPSQATLTAALECVGEFGKVGLVGERGDSVIHPSNHFIRKQITVLGSWYYSPSGYREILDLCRRGLQVDDLATHRFPLREADEAFAIFASGESGKVLIMR